MVVRGILFGINNMASRLGQTNIGVTSGSRLSSLDISKPFVQPEQPITAPELSQGIFKNFFNAFKLGTANVLQKGKDYFTTTAPQQIISFVNENTKSLRQVSGYTPDQEEAIRVNTEKVTVEATAKYQKSRQQFEQWVQTNPQLQGKPQWSAGAFKDPSILKDPDYWAYTIGSLLPFTIASIGTTGVTFAVTKNPLISATAGMAVMNPIVTQDLYDDLIDNGASNEQALSLSARIGPIISAVEVLSDIPVLKIAGIDKLFTKKIATEATKQFVKKSLASTVLKVGINIAKIETVETAEELVQEAIQNATVKVVNENRSLFENLPETAIQTLIGVLPLAVLGGISGSRLAQLPKIQEQTMIAPEVTPPAPEITPTIAPEPQKAPAVALKVEKGIEPLAQAVKGVEPKIERITEVPREQLPVGEEEKAVSRLEARMKGLLEETNVIKAKTIAEEKGFDTSVYEKMSKPEQMRQASEYVMKNQKEALQVLTGEMEAPKGLLVNSIALALEEQATNAKDADLAIKLASLRSTRMGQEISILTEAKEMSVVSAMNEIIKERTKKTEREGRISEQKKTVKEQLAKETSKTQLKIAEAEKLLNSIIC